MLVMVSSLDFRPQRSWLGFIFNLTSFIIHDHAPASNHDDVMLATFCCGML
nr:MAG TPA: hypothetical protein [Caudoviricetes sp.]